MNQWAAIFPLSGRDRQSTKGKVRPRYPDSTGLRYGRVPKFFAGTRTRLSKNKSLTLVGVSVSAFIAEQVFKGAISHSHTKKDKKIPEHLIVLIPLISTLILYCGSLNNPSKTYGPVGNFTYKTTQLLDKNKKNYHQFSTLTQPFKQKMTKQVEENLTAVSRLPEQVVPFQTTRDKNSHCKRPVQFSWKEFKLFHRDI